MTAKIYTRSGDAGETGLHRGPRVGKDCLRIEVCGTIDELNAMVGLLRAAGVPATADTILAEIQRHLFELGAEIATPEAERHGCRFIMPEHVKWLENTIDALDVELKPLTHFILPGGTHAAALAHLARTVCRRAERRLVALVREALELGTPLSPTLLAFINRLGDFFFVLGRWLNHQGGQKETIWLPPSKVETDAGTD
ncbi:MAG: cob(I)yrinic acid a,c-diamide adenosyltransferase [Thermogutta sp.]